MFPVTLTIHNAADLVKVMTALEVSTDPQSDSVQPLYTPPTEEERANLDAALKANALKQLWDLLGAEHQTAAVQAISKLKVAAPQPETKPVKAKKTEAPAEGNAPTGTPSGSDVPPALAASAPPASDAPAATTAPAIKYDDLKAAVFKLAGKSRDAAIALNKQFGVSTMKELDAARWPEALAAVNAKLAERGA